MKNDQAYRSIAASNHDEYHHMIQFFQAAVHSGCGVHRMVKRACRIKEHHGEDENAEGDNVKMVVHC